VALAGCGSTDAVTTRSSAGAATPGASTAGGHGGGSKDEKKDRSKSGGHARAGDAERDADSEAEADVQEYRCDLVAPATTRTAAGVGDSPGGVGVITGEYAVQLSTSTVAAGAIPFSIDNRNGKDEHEIAVVRAGSFDELPKDELGGVDEDRLAPGQLVAEVEKIEPGKGCTVTFDLPPGRYLVLCNVEDHGHGGPPFNHAAKGMLAPLDVTA
jgi:hypothetical protein